MKIAGWASWFDEPDNGEDIVRKGAFLRSLEQRPRVGMLFGHDGNRPVGRWDLIEERKEGLWVEGEVIDEQAANFVQSGVLFGLSIGYKGRRTVDREDGFRELLDVELLEVSLTATPMNHRCLILEITAPEEASA